VSRFLVKLVFALIAQQTNNGIRLSSKGWKKAECNSSQIMCSFVTNFCSWLWLNLTFSHASLTSVIIYINLYKINFDIYG